MADPAAWSDLEPDVSHLVTEDDTPVESFFQAKQMEILTEALRVSWDEGRPFVCVADVGLFYSVSEPAIVPDVLLSVGVEFPERFKEKGRRSYFVWVFGKPPEVAIEIVSGTDGGEDTEKLARYAQIKVPYYVIYDPEKFLGGRPLRIYQLSGASYVERVDRNFPEVGLGLALWEGEYDGMAVTWLRWTDREGRLLPTGAERAGEAERRAGEAEHRAREAERRAEAERRRVEALEERLRRLGVDPTEA